MIFSKENKESDLLLLQQIKSNNILAFDTLYEKYWEHVYAAAFKRSKDADFSKDLTQDIFLKIWDNRADMKIDHLAPYLFTSVRNNVFKWIEKEQRFTSVSDVLTELKEDKNCADTELLRTEFMTKYETLVNTLTTAQQRIFRMRFNDDLDTKEIAGKLSISRKTVQNQLAKSVVHLRGYLDLLYVVLIVFFYK